MAKVAIVNGSTEVMDVLEKHLESYTEVFCIQNENAYEEIKYLIPNLIVLCLEFEDKVGFQILSMLKLDPETADIPLVTLMSEEDGLKDPGISSVIHEEQEEEEDFFGRGTGRQTFS